MKLGDKLRILRKREHLNQTELAKRLSINKTSISQYENNYMPRARNLEKYSEYYHTTPAKLLSEYVSVNEIWDHYVETAESEIPRADTTESEPAKESVISSSEPITNPDSLLTLLQPILELTSPTTSLNSSERLRITAQIIKLTEALFNSNDYTEGEAKLLLSVLNQLYEEALEKAEG